MDGDEGDSFLADAAGEDFYVCIVGTLAEELEGLVFDGFSVDGGAEGKCAFGTRLDMASLC